MTKNFKGYSLVEKRDLPDIRYLSVICTNMIRLAQRILYLKNEDDNKAFKYCVPYATV